MLISTVFLPFAAFAACVQALQEDGFFGGAIIPSFFEPNNNLFERSTKLVAGAPESQVIESSSSWSSSSSQTDKDGHQITTTQSSMDMTFGPFGTAETACTKCQNVLSSTGGKQTGSSCYAIGTTTTEDRPATFYARGSTPDVVHSLGFVKQIEGANKSICQCGEQKENNGKSFCETIDKKMLEEAANKEQQELEKGAAGPQLALKNAITPAKNFMGRTAPRHTRLRSALLPESPLFSDDAVISPFGKLSFGEDSLRDEGSDSLFGKHGFGFFPQRASMFDDLFPSHPDAMFDEDLDMMRTKQSPSKKRLRGDSQDALFTKDGSEDPSSHYSYSMSTSSSSYGADGTKNAQVSMTGKFGPFENELAACNVCFERNPKPESVACMASIGSSKDAPESYAEFATPNVLLSEEFRSRSGQMCGCVKGKNDTKCDTRLQKALNSMAEKLQQVPQKIGDHGRGDENVIVPSKEVEQMTV